MIPMVDLRRQYLQLKEEIDAAVLDVLDKTQFILGPNVSELEAEVARYHGVPHAIGVANGTDALLLALRALGIGAGDEVITTPFTFIATAEVAGLLGAVPVFVDVDPKTFNIDPALIEKAVTKRTKAIIPVHLFGQPCDMDPILAVAKKHGLKVIEDCAQAFGARYKGKIAGTLGDAACFSFFPSKNLACYGDGGMVITGDAKTDATLRMLRNHGSNVRYYHSLLGYNSRLDELQAAIVRVKLKRIPEAHPANRHHPAFRSGRLSSCLPPVHPPHRPPGSAPGSALALGHRQRHLLPGSPSPAGGLPGQRKPSRGSPGKRCPRRTGPVASHVPGNHGGRDHHNQRRDQWFGLTWKACEPS
jgi:dTDP-4-amino-4,6-dideoxygalactose transaminase